MHDRLSEFLSFLVTEKSASANTVAAYRSDLQQLADYLKSRGDGKCLNKVDRTLIQDFILDLKRRNYAETTVARKVAAIRSFFSFLAAEGVISGNPTEGLTSPPVGKMLPKAISPDEVAELLAQAGKRTTPEARRDRTMLELLYATGMLVTELASLDIDNLSLDSEHPTVRWVEKAAKERIIPIHEQATEALHEYLDEARPLLVRNKNEKALFVNRRGERLTRQGLWLILKGYAKATNLRNDVTPRTLRHSFAAHMLRGGMPLRDVQEILGHVTSARRRSTRASRRSG